MEFNDQVMKARSRGSAEDILPERTDMTRDEVVELIHAPIEQVVQETERELVAEIEASPSKGFDEIVDQINEELDLAANTVNRKKKGRQ